MKELNIIASKFKPFELNSCKCVGITCGSSEGEAQKVLMSPKHMVNYLQIRRDRGMSKFVTIDPCIAKEIQYLWDNNIFTYGCCCGHNYLESFVNVDEKDINWMIENGYTQNHLDKTRKDTFKLKSV